MRVVHRPQASLLHQDTVNLTSTITIMVTALLLLFVYPRAFRNTMLKEKLRHNPKLHWTFELCPIFSVFRHADVTSQLFSFLLIANIHSSVCHVVSVYIGRGCPLGTVRSLQSSSFLFHRSQTVIIFSHWMRDWSVTVTKRSKA
jgi:hypothetical protein